MDTPMTRRMGMTLTYQPRTDCCHTHSPIHKNINSPIRLVSGATSSAAETKEKRCTRNIVFRLYPRIFLPFPLYLATAKCFHQQPLVNPAPQTAWSLPPDASIFNRCKARRYTIKSSDQIEAQLIPLPLIPFYFPFPPFSAIRSVSP